ncbi:hypothetical protein Tco_0527787 [Tanacetum coccineum]
MSTTKASSGFQDYLQKTMQLMNAHENRESNDEQYNSEETKTSRGLSSELLGASTTIYSTGWTMTYVKSLTDEQLIAEFEKIRMAVADLKSHELRRTLKRAGEALAPDTSKKQKSTEATHPSVPDVAPTTRPEDEAPILCRLLLVRGGLKDFSRRCKGSFVWNHQQHWQIRSWRLYTLSNVHVLETVSGEVLYMFTDVSYPLSVKLMERMLKHKLEIAKDVVGNDMTTAEQLILFIKNQLVAAQVSLA